MRDPHLAPIDGEHLGGLVFAHDDSLYLFARRQKAARAWALAAVTAEIQDVSSRQARPRLDKYP